MHIVCGYWQSLGFGVPPPTAPWTFNRAELKPQLWKMLQPGVATSLTLGTWHGASLALLAAGASRADAERPGW